LGKGDIGGFEFLQFWENFPKSSRDQLAIAGGVMAIVSTIVSKGGFRSISKGIERDPGGDQAVAHRSYAYLLSKRSSAIAPVRFVYSDRSSVSRADSLWMS
jgi:hypothetical protein